MNYTLITGASGGIGEALAIKLAERKHNLLLVARSVEKLEVQCNMLSNKFGINVQYIAADLSNLNTVKEVFDECKYRNLSVTVLVNNAGIGSSGEFVKSNLQSELEMLQLNNSAMVMFCRLFLPEMISKKIGTIINVGSLASFFPSPYMTVYAASKAFVRSFTQALTEECKPYGVNVMLFCPGFTSSNFMNTPHNKNEWGKSVGKNVYTQTPEQVATEMIQALDKKKNFHISGRRNAIQIGIANRLLSHATIAKMFAVRKRKEMNT